MDYSQDLLTLFKSKEVQERFWAKVAKNKDCWEWLGACSSFGYGRFKLQGKLYGPHVLSLWSHLEESPEGRQVCHTCDNPSCVNPKHLWYGSRSDNMKDAHVKGRLTKSLTKARKTYSLTREVWANAKITEAQALEIISIRKQTGKGPKAIHEILPSIGFTTIEGIIYNQRWKHLPR